jgi:hypothetical protein
VVTFTTPTRSSPRDEAVARDPYHARRRLSGDGPAYFAIDAVAELLSDPESLPITIRILL